MMDLNIRKDGVKWPKTNNRDKFFRSENLPKNLINFRERWILIFESTRMEKNNETNRIFNSLIRKFKNIDKFV